MFLRHTATPRRQSNCIFCAEQGCQMVSFQTQNTNLGKISRAFYWKKVGIFFGHFEFNTAIWYILWPFGSLVAIWYIFPKFGIFRREKSGNPVIFVVVVAFLLR
jgi:hypothetical protein